MALHNLNNLKTKLRFHSNKLLGKIASEFKFPISTYLHLDKERGY